jgi:hypothetical protein
MWATGIQVCSFSFVMVLNMSIPFIEYLVCFFLLFSLLPVTFTFSSLLYRIWEKKTIPLVSFFLGQSSTGFSLSNTEVIAISINLYLSYFFILVRLGFEFRALWLQNRNSTTWATTPDHFALFILEIGVSRTICLGWPQISILPILAFQVPRIYRCELLVPGNTSLIYNTGFE